MFLLSIFRPTQSISGGVAVNSEPSLGNVHCAIVKPFVLVSASTRNQIFLRCYLTFDLPGPSAGATTVIHGGGGVFVLMVHLTGLPHVFMSSLADICPSVCPSCLPAPSVVRAVVVASITSLLLLLALCSLSVGGGVPRLSWPVHQLSKSHLAGSGSWG